jgi:hypothetical protein
VHRLLVRASVVPSSQIDVTLMKEALSSSETSVLTRATRLNIAEDTILHITFKVSIMQKHYIFLNRPFLETRTSVQGLRFSWRRLWRMPSSGMLYLVTLARMYFPPKRRLLQEPHIITFQKTAFFKNYRRRIFHMKSGLHFSEFHYSFCTEYGRQCCLQLWPGGLCLCSYNPVTVA